MPLVKEMYGMGFDPRLFAVATFPAAYALELHHWSDAAQLSLVSGASEGDQAVTYTARAIGAARTGNAEQARKEIAQLEGLQKKLEPRKNKNQEEYGCVTTDLTAATT